LNSQIQLQLEHRIKEVALFNLAIDSKLRSSDLVTLRVRDVTSGNTILRRAMILQQKTKQLVQFEITEQTRDSLSKWIDMIGLNTTLYGTHTMRNESNTNLSSN
jgi:integrase